MSNYSIVPNAALTATANAIRTKSGSQATIEFDHNTGFKDAVDAIPTGGETEPPMLDVDFIDYDGTLLYSYSAADFLAMAALPANPSHDGLTAQGWNWTLADAKAYVQEYGMLVIGQNYVTTDGKTHLYIKLSEEDNTGLSVSVVTKNTVNQQSKTIDWGDGTSDTYTDGNATTNTTHTHTYASYGDYVIKYSSPDSYYLGYDGTGGGILGNGENNRSNNICRKIEIGLTAVATTRTSFAGMHKLESISIPTNLTTALTGGSGNGTFLRCAGLKGLVFPNGLTSLGMSIEAESLRFVSFPKTITSLSGLSNPHKLKKLTLPSMSSPPGPSNAWEMRRVSIPGTYTSVSGDFLRACSALVSLTLPATLTSFSGYAYSWPNSLKELHCLPTTPPTNDNTRLVNSLPDNCVIYVPYSEDHSILEAYQTATNWSVGASKMVEEEPQ